MSTTSTYIWGLCSKNITKIGAFAGIIAGFLTVAGITLIITLTSSFKVSASHSPEMGVAAMVVSFVIVPLVSFLTKNTKNEKERVEEIFSCYKNN